MNLWSEFVIWLTVKPRLRRLKKLLPDAEISPCGSRYVCSPPRLTTDIDFLVYTETSVDSTLVEAGYRVSGFTEYFGSDVQGSEFFSWRKGVVNLIVTSSRKFADQHNVATHICKTRNVCIKNHRVAVYEALRGNFDFYWGHSLGEMHPELRAFLESLKGPHGHAILQVYKIKNGLVP